MMDKKIRTARLSIFSNAFLIIIKLTVGIISGSVSIISETIHSSIDLFASLIAFFAVKIGNSPPDKEHNYGHGKYENLSGLAEGILIAFASFCIIFEAVKRLINPKPIESIGLGFIVMAVSAVLNFIVSRRLHTVAKETDSIAMEADSLHLKTDIWSSIGVCSGLLLIWITGLNFLDSLVAIFVALFILREAFILIKNAFLPLVDTSLPENEIQIITNELLSKSLHFHDLKTRKVGRSRFVDLHLELPQNLSLKEVHNVCDDIENNLKQKIKYLEVNIHAEPIET